VLAPDDVVLVTGASSGIGLEVARLVAERGCHVALLARGWSGLHEAAVHCADAGARSTQLLPCDVGDANAVSAAVDEVLERHGRLDAVVNAAGVIAVGPFGEVPVDVFDRVVRTNLLGSANISRAVLPVMRDQQRGTLVLFGSLLGHIVAPYAAPYVVSKWGVRALARALEAENRDARGVRIGYLAPAGVDTPIYQRAANYVGHPLQPPWPTSGPGPVAQDALDILDGRRRPRLAPALPRALHLAARVGSRLLPDRAYDALGKLVLAAAAIDGDARAEPDPGAVLEPTLRTGPSIR
jgi:short-subunit dehydrogenase